MWIYLMAFVMAAQVEAPMVVGHADSGVKSATKNTLRVIAALPST